jgi:hypothetical protein
MAFTTHAFAASWTEHVLYSFQGGSDDGSDPAGGVVFDKAGNLYGATTGAGGSNCAPIGNECGLVYQQSPPAKQGDPWTETILYQFQGKDANDGSVPEGGVIIDSAGNLYGTTAYGGTGDCVLLGVNAGCGTVYELSPPQQKGQQWTETILYSFESGNDGYFPWGSLTFDSKGNLYGATQFGGGKGTSCDPYFQYCGTVFEMSPPKEKGGKWTEKVLHSFAGMTNGKQMGDGANPNGGLVLDRKGAVYGTTYTGGYNCPHNSGQGCGTVFKLHPPSTKGGAWAEKVIHRFNPGHSYEEWPMAGLIIDKNGHLFGTTHEDTVFRLSRSPKRRSSWSETILYSFKGKGASYALDAPLIFDATGSLYTTAYGGSGGSVDGNVFRLRPPANGDISWTIDVLYSFAGSPDGAWPAAGLIFDKHGNLYSTTQAGGSGQACQSGCGTVFEVST